ncbi:MAG: autotransporter outer membrane beta-barrel domain-containing protein, partial [Alphaproteobacteria bacterium]|nr:autotransporter outer membrane beta-barrel domain-containing protein [Alphaproteobacteria bacterium]
MKLKNLLLASVFSMAMIGTANSVTLNVTQDEDLPTGADYSGNSGSGFVHGIYITGGASWEIITGGDINASNNISTGSGAFGLRNVASTLAIKNTSPQDRTLFLNNNGSTAVTNTTDDNAFGLYLDSPANLTIENMNLEINNNTSANRGGFGVANNGTMSIIGNISGNNYLHANSNIGATGSYGISSAGTLNIHNMSIETNGNGGAGVRVTNGSATNIIGVLDGTNTLQANNNTEVAGTFGQGLLSTGAGSELNIENMDVKANGNHVSGINVTDGGKINITGIAEGRNTLQVNDNQNIAGTDGKGLYAEGAGSEIIIENMDVEVSENGLYGIFSENGGKIEITGATNGSNIMNVQNIPSSVSSTGIYSTASSEVNIENMGINLNHNYYGIRVNSGSSIKLESTDNDVLKIDNSSIYAMAAGDTGSVIDIKGYDVSILNSGRNGIFLRNASSLNITGDASARNTLLLNNNTQSSVLVDGTNSQLNIENMDIYATNNDVFSAIKGGAIDLENTSVTITDSSKLALFSDGAGIFNVTNSEIMGSMATDTGLGASSDINLDNTVWRSVGRSNVSNLSLSGNNDLYMDIYFGNSTTQGDMLTIEDSATGSGTTTLHLTSAGGDGGMNDAIVINQENATGSTLSDSDFTLANMVDSGFYEYDQLGMDGNNNIVLQSNGVVTNTAKTIAQMPAMHINIVKTGMNELRKRLGELRENSPRVANGAWVRTYAKHLDVNEKIDAKMNLYGLEAGYDYQVYSDCENKAYAGIMAGYLYTDNIKISQDNGHDGKGHAKTPSVGIYGTWLNNKGWFADATMRYFWSDMKANSVTAGGQSISYKPNRDFITASIEGGKRFEYELSKDEKYIIEPKAEFQYAHAKAKSFTTNNNMSIHYGKTDSKALRVGSMFGYETYLDNDTVLEPFIEINAIQEFGGKTNVHYAGGDTKSDVSGFSVEVGGGL